MGQRHPSLLSAYAREGFFPPKPFFLLTGAAGSQHARYQAAGHAGADSQKKELVHDESFGGGSC